MSHINFFYPPIFLLACFLLMKPRINLEASHFIHQSFQVIRKSNEFKKVTGTQPITRMMKFESK